MSPTDKAAKIRGPKKDVGQVTGRLRGVEVARDPVPGKEGETEATVVNQERERGPGLKGLLGIGGRGKKEGG